MKPNKSCWVELNPPTRLDRGNIEASEKTGFLPEFIPTKVGTRMTILPKSRRLVSFAEARQYSRNFFLIFSNAFVSSFHHFSISSRSFHDSMSFRSRSLPARMSIGMFTSSYS